MNNYHLASFRSRISKAKSTLESNVTSQPKRLFSDAILVALAPASVYIISYFYELGYCAHFEIPRALITPNSATVLLAAAAVGAFFFFSLQAFGFSVPLLRASINPTQRQRPYHYFFWVNAIFLIFGIILLRAYGFQSPGGWLFLGGWAVLNFLLFGIDLIVYREKPLAERFDEINRARNSDPLDVWRFLDETFGKKFVVLPCAVVLLCGFAWIVGNGEAVRQQAFMTFKDPKNFALLRTYGELMIAAPIDREKRLVERELTIFRIPSRDKWEFRIETLGALQLRPLLDVASRSSTDPMPPSTKQNGSTTEIGKTAR